MQTGQKACAPLIIWPASARDHRWQGSAGGGNQLPVYAAEWPLTGDVCKQGHCCLAGSHNGSQCCMGLSGWQHRTGCLCPAIPQHDCDRQPAQIHHAPLPLRVLQPPKGVQLLRCQPSAPASDHRYLLPWRQKLPHRICAALSRTVQGQPSNLISNHGCPWCRDQQQLQNSLVCAFSRALQGVMQW